MSDHILRSLMLSKDTSVIRGIHWLARGVYQTRKYHWELRRNGETKLGYWKKTLRKKSSRSSYPKRFVLIPGFGDTPLSWSLVMSLLHPILKRHYDEVILFDFPGFSGFLSNERSFPSMDLMTTAVNDALDALKPHTIMGHSLGGWLAAIYGGACGEGLRPTSNKLNFKGPETLILANPSGIFLNQEIRHEWEGIFRAAMVQGFPALRPHLFAKEPVWFKYIAPHFSQFLHREDVHQFMNTFRDDHSAERPAAQIQSKVWLVWGQDDSLIPSVCTQAWFNHLNPKHQDRHHAVWIKGVGHSPHIEKPAVTAAVIAQILRGQAPHSLGKKWWKTVDPSHFSSDSNSESNS